MVSFLGIALAPRPRVDVYIWLNFIIRCGAWGTSIRKFLTVVGALACVIAVLGAVGFIYVIDQGLALSAGAKAYVDRTVPFLVTHWSSAAVLSVAAPELKKVVTADQTEKISVYFEELGPFEKYEGCVGQATSNFSTGSGSTVTGDYLAEAKFKNGTATFKISLIKRNKTWTVASFFVEAKISSAAHGEKGT
jgi:hypothetical protein